MVNRRKRDEQEKPVRYFTYSWHYAYGADFKHTKAQIINYHFYVIDRIGFWHAKLGTPPTNGD